MTIWRLYFERRGTHVHGRLFAGPRQGALGLVGRLCFRAEEWAEFQLAIRQTLPIDFVEDPREELMT